jgi:Arc/MetJ family transcription regulator
MTKRLIEIDDALLEQARSVSQQRTIRATVEAALQNLVEAATLAEHIEWLRSDDSLDLDALDLARQPRKHP